MSNVSDNEDGYCEITDDEQEGIPRQFNVADNIDLIKTNYSQSQIQSPNSSYLYNINQ